MVWGKYDEKRLAQEMKDGGIGSKLDKPEDLRHRDTQR